MAEERRGTLVAEASTRDVGRALQLLARAARARQLYTPDNPAYQRMREDLVQTLDAVLARLSVVSLRVREDRLVYEHAPVLVEPNAKDSIPFALFRSGLRRIDLSRGVDTEELETLLGAVATGLTLSGESDDDIVALLWKHDLEHIRYLVVSGSIIEALADGGPPLDDAIEGQIDGLLQAIYGDSSDDVGARAVHLDAADIHARRIVERLPDIDDIAHGLHPARRLPEPPAYAVALLNEARGEHPERVTARAAHAALRAVHRLEGFDADAAAESLLRMFDAAVISDDLPLATRIVAGVRAAAEPSPRIERWLDEAISEARIRQAMSPAFEASLSDAAFAKLVQFLRACGPHVRPVLLPLLGQLSNAGRRRALTDLVSQLGGVDFTQVASMLRDNTHAVVQEGLRLLAGAPTSDVAPLWAIVERHPSPLARIALLEAVGKRPDAASINIATRRLQDPEPRVRLAAVECLAQHEHPDAPDVIAQAVEGHAFDRASKELKRALLSAYARTNGPRALHVLTRLIKRGEGPLVRKETEELAVHAALAAAQVEDPRARELLARLTTSKNRRIREAAELVLRRRGPAS